MQVVGRVAMEQVASGRPSPFAIAEAVNGALTRSLPWLLVLLVVQAVLIGLRNQTVGKLAVGIRIAKRDGTPADFPRAFLLRGTLTWLLVQIPLLGALFWIVDACFIFGDERRCLHDYIAGTIVVKA
jgi:uncharacterized RDD family membrane protein YckC